MKKIKNMITVTNNVFMYITVLILGVSIGSFALKTMVWFLYIMLTDTMHALGYLCLGTIMAIGVATGIDKVRE